MKKTRAPVRSKSSLPVTDGFRTPAEWEPHAATWLAWPHNQSDWPGKGLMVEWVFVEMARHGAPRERVRIVVADRSQERRARTALSRSGVPLGRVDFFRSATDRSWTRDFLPNFVIRGRGQRRAIGAVKWRFNGWARYDDYANDDATGAAIAARFAERVWKPATTHRGRLERIVLEGGAIDVDGDGSLLATEQCLLTGRYARNRALGREGTERVFLDYLGIKKVIWLAEGIAGDDTCGHIDDFARFVAPGRVIVCQETNRRDPNHQPLRSARDRLEAARDARGRKLDVIRLPMPEPVVFAGQRLPASYANFYLANELVLVPTFNDAADKTALGILAELFPKRRVVGIYCRDLVLGLGTLHCSTQQEPG